MCYNNHYLNVSSLLFSIKISYFPKDLSNLSTHIFFLIKKAYTVT